MAVPKGNPKIIRAWTMYDWANSVYSLVVTSTFLPEYYNSITGDKDPESVDMVDFLGFRVMNSSLYDYSFAFALLIVALISPILSSIADYKGYKKGFLNFFCILGSASCVGLYLFRDLDTLPLGILFSVLACIGFWGSIVFYNSYLPEIAEPKDHDAISARGFSMGYIGGIILQLIGFVLFFKPEWFGMEHDGTLPLRWSFVLVGLWWFGFAQWSLRRLPKGTPVEQRPQFNLFTNGFIELRKVWDDLKHRPVIKRFLLSYFFYNMGVQTIMLSATIYGSKELGIPTTGLIVAILLIQVVAIVGAWGMAKISKKLGNLRTLMAVVALWAVLCILAYWISLIHLDGTEVSVHFYVLACFVGLVMGGVQSLSRSTYSKLMPETHDTTAYFSFFDSTEKICTMLGLLGFGLIEDITGNIRNSVLFMVIIFLLGLVALYFTRRKEVELQKA